MLPHLLKMILVLCLIAAWAPAQADEAATGSKATAKESAQDGETKKGIFEGDDRL